MIAIVMCMGIAMPALAQRVDAPPPPPYLKDVGIDQHLDAQVPLELMFRDEAGNTVALRDLVHDKPIVLALVYYECPMLCTMVLNELNRTIRTLSFEVGKEFDILTISFDPRETPQLAAAKKEHYTRAYGREGENVKTGWRFLTGDQPSIDKLTQTVGFRYTWDEKTEQFAHASGIIVLTPQGRISRYFYGIDYAPNDLRLALLEASNGKIGGLADVVLQYCFHYNPATGKYSLAIMNILRALGIVTLIAVGGFIVRSVRQERQA